MPSVVAFVPARSGSKRVIDKNARMLGGHPLMAYAISAARQSGVFDAVICSTDSERYAELARHYGAEVPFLRPAEFATSTSPDVEWVEDTLKRLRAEGRSYDCFSILRPTSPFRSADTIRRAWAAFTAEEGIDSLRAVEKVTQHPGKMWLVQAKRMIPLLQQSPGEQPWHSSQMAALPEVFVQNASLEIAWSKVAIDGRTIAGVNVMPFFTDEAEGFDINNQYDWDYAEAVVAQGKFPLPEVAEAPFVDIKISEGSVWVS
ncbi:MAG TPA: acylneuraminate cytidylyltransferase family protein [Methyloceanibacter sp.]|nr:acylneuraminate cytidylyltransferase family protein [Methyloceanibacter sp.]